MTDLVEWYNVNIRENPWSLLVATEFIFRFLAIHPFQDGNGRLGRALFILTLLQSDDRYFNEITPYIAIDRHIEQNRSLYYSTLHKCSEGKFHDNPQKYNICAVRCDNPADIADRFQGLVRAINSQQDS
jgi:Fic family protein